LASSGWWIRSGDVLVKQASLGDGLSFDACTLEQDRLACAEVNVCRRQIAQAFVVAVVVVVIDQAFDLGFEVTGQFAK
jgi:hypothetical protein